MSLLCEWLHVRLQHCGRRSGVGNWSLRSFFLAMFVAHRAIDKCPNGNLTFQTDAETISAVQVGAIRREMLNGWLGCCQRPARAGSQASFPSDRKSVVKGTRVAVRVGLGGRRLLTKKEPP